VTTKKMSLVENNEAIAKRKSGQELSSYAPTDFELNESFGGSSEYTLFLRPSLWSFSFIRLFGQEEE
jgi:hypothetical protein